MLNLTVDKAKNRWHVNKEKYMKHPHIPAKWKSGKHYIYFKKFKYKQWYFICDKDGDDLIVVAACNAKALAR